MAKKAAVPAQAPIAVIPAPSRAAATVVSAPDLAQGAPLEETLVEVYFRNTSESNRPDCFEWVLSDVSLCVTKRKPFGVLAERAFLKIGRGNWHSFERRRARLWAKALTNACARMAGAPA